MELPLIMFQILSFFLKASLLQVTNYGLGGLVEDHNDPYGYNEGAHLTPEVANLVHSGDIMATLMGKEPLLIKTVALLLPSEWQNSFMEIQQINAGEKTVKFKDKLVKRKYISGWLSETTAGGATTFFNGVDLVSPSLSPG